MIKNYYKILGVSKQATEEEIKEAYRQLAKKYHPDTNEEPDAHELFIDIKEAHETLSDTEKRDAYNVALTAFQNQLAPPKPPSSYEVSRKKRRARYQRGHFTKRSYARQSSYAHARSDNEAAQRNQALRAGAQIGFQYLAYFGRGVSILALLLTAGLLLDYFFAYKRAPQTVLAKGVQAWRFGEAGGIWYRTAQHEFKLPRSYGKYLHQGSDVDLVATPVGEFVTKIYVNSTKVGLMGVKPVGGLFRGRLLLILALFATAAMALRPGNTPELVSYLGLANAIMFIFLIRALLGA